MKVHCKTCDSMVPAEGVHSCYDAERVTRHREAERAVIEAVKQFLAICNNETVSDSNAAAWAIGEMEAAYATLRELEARS